MAPRAVSQVERPSISMLLMAARIVPVTAAASSMLVERLSLELNDSEQGLCQNHNRPRL